MWPVRRSVRLSVRLSVHPFVNLSVVCLSTRVSVCPGLCRLPGASIPPLTPWSKFSPLPFPLPSLPLPLEVGPSYCG